MARALPVRSRSHRETPSRCVARAGFVTDDRCVPHRAVMGWNAFIVKVQRICPKTQPGLCKWHCGHYRSVVLAAVSLSIHATTRVTVASGCGCATESAWVLASVFW